MALEFLMILDRLALLPGLGKKRLGNNRDGSPRTSSRLAALSYRVLIRVRIREFVKGGIPPQKLSWENLSLRFISWMFCALVKSMLMWVEKFEKFSSSSPAFCLFFVFKGETDKSFDWFWRSNLKRMFCCFDKMSS
ncbi:hypothetical protein CEXT_395241 [Caerostris extrusa]|uniref:Uncharacterized protein n=1 Tax=Caerostris extrusa TaxID=172846 RepID=A0AAV4W8R2_CAEEX|nr:hypothetical protein CEXT_395241 [Caerostris extrusa]